MNGDLPFPASPEIGDVIHVNGQAHERRGGGLMPLE
jgi:hypothetical protein